MTDKEKIGKFKEKIEGAGKVLITTHLNADGDAIGTSLGLARLLKKMNKDVQVITPNDFPVFLHWIPGVEMVTVYRNNKLKAEKIIAGADLIFCIDYNEGSRLEKAEEAVFSSHKFKILIDHHPGPAPLFDLEFCDSSYGSAAEFLYVILKKAGYDYLFDREIAECIFTGIMTDTGNFSYSCSYPEVWANVAELISLGVDKARIHSLVYDHFTEKRMKLMGYCLNEKLQVFHELNAAVISLSRKELHKFDHQPGDTEGFVNLPFSIEGINLTALFIEKRDHVKISFRSRGDFPVNSFSSEYFRGGGHLNAAGGEWDKPIEKAIERFIKVLRMYQKRLNG